MAVTNAQIQEYIRFWLGNLPESVISEEDFNKVIEIVRIQYPSATDCQYYYYVTVAILNWIIRSESQGSAGAVGTGEVSSRKERRGSTEIEVEYDTGTSSGTSASWDTILEDLLENPDSVGCSVFTETTSSSTGSVVLGGCDISAYDAPYQSMQRKEDSARKNRNRPKGMFNFR